MFIRVVQWYGKNQNKRAYKSLPYIDCSSNFYRYSNDNLDQPKIRGKLIYVSNIFSSANYL